MSTSIDFSLLQSSKTIQDRIARIKCDLETAPLSAGREYLKKHVSGNNLSAKQRGVGHCCECMGYYVDGKMDCECPWCILYPLMPYGKMRKMRKKEKKQI